MQYPALNHSSSEDAGLSFWDRLCGRTVGSEALRGHREAEQFLDKYPTEKQIVQQWARLKQGYCFYTTSAGRAYSNAFLDVLWPYYSPIQQRTIRTNQ